MNEWTEVARVESDGRPFKAELARALDSFLAERGMSRTQIADDDVRVDLVYLGPAIGRCARRVLVRTAALTGYDRYFTLTEYVGPVNRQVDNHIDL